ncbi:MAG: PIN domain-containing protein [Thiotrichaceae bacterium]|nr:PIN domain-containing protein [Thiotrichaceae bacterium]
MLKLKEAGCYRFGIQCGEEYIWLGILEINSIEGDNSKLGQWYFKLQINNEENNLDIAQQNKFTHIMLDISCRLGLQPIIFKKEFQEILTSNKPICLVADTNSLLHGHFEQAIRLRSNNPTHISIPDQVYMEVQLQRERNISKESSPSNDETVEDQNNELTCIQKRRSRKFQFSVYRAIKRIENMGVIVHYTRPPEAMVRYFGSDTDDREIGASYYRDRLILEALRNQRVQLPNVPVWLVTGDANFAIQAELEGFNIGFAKQPQLKNDILFLTSPYIEPVSFIPYHLPVEPFLEECLWDWGRILLQKKDDPNILIWDIQNQQQCKDILLGTAQLNDFFSSTSNKNGEKFEIAKETGCSLSSENTISVIKRAPAMSSIIKELVAEENSKKSPQIISYLQAFNWFDRDKKSLTTNGKKFIQDWKQLESDDIETWYSLLQNMAQIASTFDKQQQLQNVLQQHRKPIPDKKLAEFIQSFSARDAQSQSTLASALGLAVRMDGFTWYVEPKKIEEAARIIYDTIKQLLQRNKASSAVRVDTVFTTLLDTTPLSFPNFRIGLYRLYRAEKIKFTGTVPDSVGKSVKILTIAPVESVSHSVDLGAGDFLIPNESSQAILLIEG